MGVAYNVCTKPTKYLQIAASPAEAHEDDWGLELMT